MIKLLHTSDWHLGRVLHEKPLLEDQAHVLGQITEILHGDPHDLLVVAGDIYDRSLPPADAVALLSRFLTELRRKSEVTVVMIPGNHDSALRLSYCAEMLSLSGIHIRSEAACAHEPIRLLKDNNTVNIYAIPFLEPGIFDAHREGEDAVKGSHEEALEHLTGIIRSGMDKSAVNICVGHLYTRRGLTSDSERVMVGGAGDVDPALFDDFTYTALGHLHRPQGVSGKVHYSGSPMKYSFSECGDTKGVLSVTIAGEIQDIAAIPLTPLRDMARLRGSFQSLLNDGEFLEYRGHYVEAELTDGGIITNPLVSLRERFPHILSVRQAAPQMKSGERSTAPSISEKGTLEDDYRAFHAHIHGEEASAETMDLFEKIRRERNIP